MGHKTEGRAKCEVVNMMLNSAYLSSTNAKNHITISISTHSYRAAFNKRTVLNALSKLMDTAAWLCNQCFLQSAVVELGAVIYDDFGFVSPNWRSGLNNLFSEYEPTVVIGESSIHELFSWYNSILFIINKLKLISTPFGCVKLFSIGTASH